MLNDNLILHEKNLFEIKNFIYLNLKLLIDYNIVFFSKY